MAQQTINIGTAPNDGTGDSPRVAGDKINDNFTEIYAKLATSTTVGRLARYTDATGAQGQTSGIFEDASGNVGIGTTAPARLVHAAVNTNNIQVPLRISNDSTGDAAVVRQELKCGDTTALFVQYGSGHASSANLFQISTVADFAFVAGGVECLRGVSSGRIGINKTSPTTALDVNGPIRTATYTVATLPSAATVGAGSRAYVTDATATTFASTVAGGGANKVPVYSDGTNWLIG